MHLGFVAVGGWRLVAYDDKGDDGLCVCVWCPKFVCGELCT